MLLLQLKDLVVLKLPKKTIFLIKLSLFCAGVHSLALLLFFLFPDTQKTIFLDTLNVHDAKVIFVPLLKTGIEQQKTSSVLTAEKTTITPKKNEQAAIVDVPAKKEPIKKVELKKAEPPKTTMAKKEIQKNKNSSLQKQEPKKSETTKKTAQTEQKKKIEIKQKKLVQKPPKQDVLEKKAAGVSKIPS
jgi:outer membrane biosynthesis protein TonB